MTEYTHRFNIFFRNQFLCRLALFDDFTWRRSAHPDAVRYRRLRAAIISAIVQAYGSCDRNDLEDIRLMPHQTSEGRIRLGCLYCDRDDCDGIDQVPDDWKDVAEVQSLEEATRKVAMDERARSSLDWETHTGVCPDCQRTHH